ncbi:trypsin [Drosophila obscura]|uniref:trypsin n=1 Tax=Drosophila obscura TaxID=7282 RepID=UPI001BB2A939|nr:trypsin [Drosophila obscura]
MRAAIRMLLPLLLLVHVSCKVLFINRVEPARPLDTWEKDILQDSKYVVSIRTAKPIRFWGDNHFCGGFVITSTWVITSARCVSVRPPSNCCYPTERRNLMVVIDTQNRLDKPSSEKQIAVKKVVLHPKFKGFRNDLAMLKLKSSVPKYLHHSQSKLPNEGIEKNKSCMALGWGRMYTDGPMTNEMMVLMVSTQPEHNCQRSSTAPDPGKTICVVSRHGYGSSCQGDLGTPLFCGQTLYGVMGRGEKCQEYGPMMFTSIYEHMSFIISTIDGSMPRRSSGSHPDPNPDLVNCCRPLMKMLIMLLGVWVALLVGSSGCNRCGF